MKVLHVFAALAVCCSGLVSAYADTYPSHVVKLVVPWPAGGFTDRLGRMVAEKLSASIGQPVIVDNRPGASAAIGSEYVMRAAPDGYTLLITSTDGTVKLMQDNDKDKDPVTQLTQITMLASQPVTLAVGPKFQGDSLAQFIQAAKANPGGIAYASNGEGGATHLGMEIFAQEAGIKLTHIPYKGTAPALTDLIGGQVEATLVSVQGIGSFLDSGRARALAITSAKRSPAAPNVPTFAESGFPKFDLSLWYGLVGPKGLPAAVVAKLSQAAQAAINAPDVQQQLRSAAAEPLGGSPQDMQLFIEKEAARWRTIIR
jgi:tripartite-type tricarboxylate transporter receptor subunit TctC